MKHTLLDNQTRHPQPSATGGQIQPARWVLTLLPLLLALLSAGSARAANRYAVATANWNVTSTWSATFGGPSGASVPGSSDDVFISQTNTALTVTIPSGYAAQAKTVTLWTNNTATLGGITFTDGTSSLTTAGDVMLRFPNAGATRNLAVNAGTLTVGGNLRLGVGQAAGNGTRITEVTITTGTVNVTGNLVFNDGAFATPNAGNNRVILSGAGNFNLGGNFTLNGTTPTGTLTPGTTSTFTYNGSGAQTVAGISSINYNHLTINKSAGTATLTGSKAIVGNLTVSGGTLALGAFTLNRSTAGGTLTVANGATLRLGGTGTIPANYNTHAIGATSTIDYYGTSQTIGALNSAQSYGHLSVSLSGTATVATPAKTVRGTLALNSGTVNSASFLTLASGAAITRDTGSLTGTPTFSGTVDVSYTGTTAVNTGSELPTSTSALNNLTVAKSGGVTLSGTAKPTVNGALTLTSGEFVTSSNQVNLAAAATWARTSGWVNGTLQKAFSTGSGQSFTFPIGGLTYYRPVALANLNVGTAGTLLAVVTATAANHPQISTSGVDPSHDVSRYWTLTAGGGFVASTYDVTLSFDATDVLSGATPGSFVVRRYSSSAWTATTTGTRTSTSTAATGLTGLGDLVVGEPLAARLVVTLPSQTFTSGSGNSGTVSAQTAGSSFSIASLSAVDIFNTVAPSYAGLKTISYSGPGTAPGGALPVYTTNVTFTSGQAATLATTLKKAESVTITATDDILTGVASSSLTVGAAAVSAAVSTVSASASSVLADGSTTATITVTLRDAYGNPVSGKAVALAKSSGSGTPTITITQGTTDVSGVATFTVKSTTAAADVFTATNSTDSNLAITQTATVTFTAGAVHHFAIAPSPITGSHPVGTAIPDLTLIAQDVNNNTVTTFVGSVTYGGTAGASGNSSVFTSGVLSGASVTPTKAGTSLTLTVTDANSHTGSTTIATLTPGTLHHYHVKPALPVYTGVPFVTTILAQDQYDNLVTSSGVTAVPMTSSSGSISWDANGDATFGSSGTEATAQMTNGVAYITTKDTTTEDAVTLTATTTSPALSGTSEAFNVDVQLYSFRSAASGNWNTTTTWQRWSGTAWEAAAAVPDSSSGAILIQSNHEVTATASVAVDECLLQGKLIINSGVTLTVASGGSPSLDVEGAVTNNGILLINSSATLTVQAGGVLCNAGTITKTGSIIFMGSSTYQHNFTTEAGAIPLADSWQTDSTCEIIGYTSNTSTPGGLDQGFQNFIWNCLNQTVNISLDSTFTRVKNLTVASTGSGSSAVVLGADLQVTNATLISPGAALHCGPYVLSGSTFTLDEGATLGIGSTVGITAASGSSGNIQTTTRSFPEGGSYTYNGTEAQATGSGLPSRVGHLKLANSAGLTLSANAAVAYLLDLSNGALSLGAHTLTLRGALSQTSGTLTGGGTSSLAVEDAGGAAAVTLPAISSGLLSLSVARAAGATLDGAVTVSGLTLTSGVLGGAANLTLASGGTITRAAGSLSGGTPTFAGSVASVTYTTGGITAGAELPTATDKLQALSFNHTSGTVTLAADVTANSTVTLAAGATLADGGYTLTAKGNVANSGTNSGSSRLLLSGGSAAHALTGSGYYENLELADAQGATVSDSPTLSGTLTLTTGSLGSAGNLHLGAGATLVRASGSLSAAPVFGSSVNVIYSGASSVTAGFELPSMSTILHDLTLSYSSAMLTLSEDHTVNGILTINSGSTLADGGSVLSVLGDVSNSGTHSGSGKILLNNPSSQTLSGSGTYGNLEQAQGGADLTGSPTITGTLTLPSSGLFNVSDHTLTLNGPTIAGTPASLFTTFDSSLVFGGSSSDVRVPSSVTELNGLTINNASGVTLSADLAIGGTLALTSGRLSAGSYLVHVENTDNGSVTVGTGWVDGTLQKAFAVGAAQSFNFPVGDATAARSLGLWAMNVTAAGSLRFQMISTSHPQMATSGLNPAKSLPFYWRRTAVGNLAVSQVAVTGSFTETDVGSASSSAFLVRRWNGTVWADSTVQTRTSTSLMVYLLFPPPSSGANVIGDFTAGEQLVSAYRIAASTAELNPNEGDPLTLTLVDSAGLTVDFTGDKTLTFSGLSLAGDGTPPTVTGKNGTAVAVGSATTMTFASGVSTAGGNLVAYKAETQTLQVTDAASLSSANTGGAGVSLTIANVAPVIGSTAAYSRPRNLPLRISWTDVKSQAAITDANRDVVFSLVGVDSPTAQGATLAFNASYILYTPGANGNVSDSITYNLSDGTAVTDGTIDITMQGASTSQSQNIVAYALEEGHPAITFAGIPTYSYLVQRTPSLSSPEWQTVWTTNAPTAGLFKFVDVSLETIDSVYYRTATPE